MTTLSCRLALCAVVAVLAASPQAGARDRPLPEGETGAALRPPASGTPEGYRTQVPVISRFSGPTTVVQGIACSFEVRAWDWEYDDIRLHVSWGDGRETLTVFQYAPARFVVPHTYGVSRDTVTLVAVVQDVHGARSAPESMRVAVAASGPGVPRWMWWNNDEDRASLVTSAVMTSRAGVECIGAACRRNYRFYQVRTADGRTVGSRNTLFPEYVFTGHPAANPQTGDIAAGSDEGILYVWDSMLGNERRWPGWLHEDSLDFEEWGAPAWNGNRLYLGHADDSIFYFEVYPSAIVRVAACALHATMVGAPVFDAAGHVYFATDSGYLYKMDGALNYIWRVRLLQLGDVNSPVLGAGGTTVYTVTEMGVLYAINTADGSTRWTRQLDSEGRRAAVGGGAVFVGTSFGRFYAVDTGDGSIRWQVQLGNSEIATTPILTTRGYLYVVNEVDVLYCVRMSDGQVIWACDCPSFLPRSQRSSADALTDYQPNPTITSNGDVIIVGEDAVYCICGYADALLDTSQPWPKWQHDRYNSGKQ